MLFLGSKGERAAAKTGSNRAPVDKGDGGSSCEKVPGVSNSFPGLDGASLETFLENPGRFRRGRNISILH